jgi:deoxyribodipyrimidine photo-lyase
MPHPARLRPLNDRPARARAGYVLYWMQQSQRADDNDALAHAIARANAARLPVVVGFGLTDDYPEANVRHYRFLLEGLRETAARLAARGIALVARRGVPDAVARTLAADAALVVCDRGYTRAQKRWRLVLATDAPCEVQEVEADVVVPVALASPKAEIGARTLRPRVHRHLDALLEAPAAPRAPRPCTPSLELGLRGLDLSDVDALLASLTLDRSVPPVSHLFTGGATAAAHHLRRFLGHDLDGYAAQRPHPERPAVSHMSKYLHFGQISPAAIVRAARAARGGGPNRDAFLEEIVVRRELAQNFVAYTDEYDRFDAVPGWARASLHAHERDARPYVYDRAALDRAATHDRYWNAAMREMKYTGYMHNALRMYWGKKILEWSPTPEEAHATALYLNNRYFLDGRDPNSYANVAWIFGLHDRPWPERHVFGKVRSMTASGLERKSDIGAYVERVDRLVEEARAAGVVFPAETESRPTRASDVGTRHRDRTGGEQRR